MTTLIPQSFSESSSILESFCAVGLCSKPEGDGLSWAGRLCLSVCHSQILAGISQTVDSQLLQKPNLPLYYCVAVTAQNQLASQFQVKRACHRLPGCPIMPFCSTKTELLQYVRSSSDQLLRRLLYSRFCFGLSFHISERSFFVIFAQSRTTYIYICNIYII